MEEQLQKVFRESFGIDELSDEMSYENVKQWDSMGHVGLVMALQKEFGCSISPTDAIELTDIRAIKAFLKEHGVT